MDEKTKNKSYDELAQDMCTREDSLPHLTAKAEIARRAALQAQSNGRYMLASVVVATIAAVASAASAYSAYLSTVKLPH